MSHKKQECAECKKLREQNTALRDLVEAFKTIVNDLPRAITPTLQSARKCWESGVGNDSKFNKNEAMYYVLQHLEEAQAESERQAQLLIEHDNLIHELYEKLEVKEIEDAGE